ncbi:DNA methylase N-4, partial [Siphonobacter sp. BAB-5385]
MTGIIKAYGLTNADAISELKRSMGVERIEVTGQYFTAVHNDCVLETARMQENSVDLVLTSIPFSNHYEYTPSYNDFGHTNNDQHFFEQMDFLTPQLLRVLKPGRVAAIHVKDRILFGSVTGTGMPTVNPFHAKTIFHYMAHGFAFIGQIT